jgi:G3E family GTPase
MKLILTGGFLGSGKTTAITQACSLLLKQNNKVAVITNDQGEKLADSKYIEQFSIPVKEVTKGCFCCNYNELLKNIYHFNEQINPDIIFAESVGSCTDLVATVAKPLVEMHPELSVSISVFVDVYLLHSIINGTSAFIDDEVQYIYKKQMEEADILILNKVDLLNEQEFEEVNSFMQQEYKGKKILLQNSFNEKDVELWLSSIEQAVPAQRTSLEIDYTIYGAGEAKLAWLDATVFISAAKMQASKIAAQLAELMFEKIKQEEFTIGHLKFLINDGMRQYKLSYTTAWHVENISFIHTSHTASFLINARVQTKPELLQKILYEATSEISLKTNSQVEIQSLSAFQPGFPRPTYRIS